MFPNYRVAFDGENDFNTALAVFRILIHDPAARSVPPADRILILIAPEHHPRQLSLWNVELFRHLDTQVADISFHPHPILAESDRLSIDGTTAQPLAEAHPQFAIVDVVNHLPVNCRIIYHTQSMAHPQEQCNNFLKYISRPTRIFACTFPNFSL